MYILWGNSHRVFRAKNKRGNKPRKYLLYKNTRNGHVCETVGPAFFHSPEAMRGSQLPKRVQTQGVAAVSVVPLRCSPGESCCRSAVPQGGWDCPQGTLYSIWQHFWLSLEVVGAKYLKMGRTASPSPITQKRSNPERQFHCQEKPAVDLASSQHSTERPWYLSATTSAKCFVFAFQDPCAFFWKWLLL